MSGNTFSKVRQHIYSHGTHSQKYGTHSQKSGNTFIVMEHILKITPWPVSVVCHVSSMCQKRPNTCQKRPNTCQKRPNTCQKRPNTCHARVKQSQNPPYHAFIYDIYIYIYIKSQIYILTLYSTKNLKVLYMVTLFSTHI